MSDLLETEISFFFFKDKTPNMSPLILYLTDNFSHNGRMQKSRKQALVDLKTEHLYQF